MTGVEGPSRVADLTRENLGDEITVDAWTTGALYELHDDFHDGYPDRSLTLVDDEGQEHRRTFTDSDPEGYPKTMGTRLWVTDERAPEAKPAATCDHRWPTSLDSPMFVTRCRLEPGHEEDHTNGQAYWTEHRRWPVVNGPQAGASRQVGGSSS